MLKRYSALDSLIQKILSMHSMNTKLSTAKWKFSNFEITKGFPDRQLQCCKAQLISI